MTHILQNMQASMTGAADDAHFLLRRKCKIEWNNKMYDGPLILEKDVSQEKEWWEYK